MNVQRTVSPNGFLFHIEQEVGSLCSQCESLLSPWLRSNAAGLTVSCFEIRKHVIHSQTLAAATRHSRPFNIPQSLNALAPRGSRLHHHLQQDTVCETSSSATHSR